MDIQNGVLPDHTEDTSSVTDNETRSRNDAPTNDIASGISGEST